MTILLSPYILGMGNSVLFPKSGSSGLLSAPVTVTCKGFSFLLLGLSVISLKMKKLANVTHYLSFSPKNSQEFFFTI